MSRVAENIKKYRTRRGITQSDLGKMLGKAPSVIANWEAGTNRPDVDSIAEMLEIFEIDANTFFDWVPVKGASNTINLDEHRLLGAYRPLSAIGKEAVTAYAEARRDAEKQNTSSEDEANFPRSDFSNVSTLRRTAAYKGKYGRELPPVKVDPIKLAEAEQLAAERAAENERRRKLEEGGE